MEPTPPPSRPSFALLGADAFLAARPATPVQLMHACTRGGYDAAIPATWGDELIAERCIERLAERTLGPAVFCTCSYVRDRLLAPGPDLAPFMLSFVAPPVAAARYLRQLYAGRPIDITYVGACPSADDEAIDRQVAPKAFFAELRGQGIILSQQPTIFNSMFAPDRRRCLSQPGGLPTPQLLERQSMPRELVEVAGFEYAAELAQHLILSEPVLIDLATRSGCACSGAAVGIPPTEARSSVVALEPPRSAQPIVEHDVEVPVDLPIPVPSADRAPPPPRDDAPPPRAPDADEFPDWPGETVARFARTVPIGDQRVSSPPGTDRPPSPHAELADMPTKSADVPRAAKVDVELEFRAAPVGDVTREARTEPRIGLELRTEIQPFGMNFEMQFDRAFRSAFTSVPLSLPIPRLPSTESFGFPLFDREVSLVATLDAPADASRRRNQMPRTRSSKGRTLPRAYVAHRAGSPPAGELVVRTVRAPLAKLAPEPTPPVVRVSTPTVRATVRPPEHMPLFSAFAASGVLSAATEGDTSLTRDTLRAGAELRVELRTEPAAMPVVERPVADRPAADRPVPLQRTVEAPARRRSTPVARTRVVRPPSGLALIGHWLRQIRLRHLALIIIGLITIAISVAFALGYLPEPGVATGPAPAQTVHPTTPST
ncbi:MAG TPA: hypothetical protein VNV25_19310 [Gemmatimonadaceae bacterium]|nr:hypothetical protein [Gemmatimonadaceae bacterium]